MLHIPRSRAHRLRCDNDPSLTIADIYVEKEAREANAAKAKTTRTIGSAHSIQSWFSPIRSKATYTIPANQDTAYSTALDFPQMFAATALPFPIMSIRRNTIENSRHMMMTKAHTGMIPTPARQTK